MPTDEKARDVVEQGVWEQRFGGPLTHYPFIPARNPSDVWDSSRTIMFTS